MKINNVLDLAIDLLDFSKNNSYINQDEVQGYHWGNNSCSLHSIVIYTFDSKYESKIIAIRMCIISDALDYDVVFIYVTQK